MKKTSVRLAKYMLCTCAQQNIAHRIIKEYFASNLISKKESHYRLSLIRKSELKSIFTTLNHQSEVTAVLEGVWSLLSAAQLAKNLPLLDLVGFERCFRLPKTIIQ
jgi:hypothetical protein